jgi:hypothetical protein
MVINNDERQFNAPGVRIPMLSLSRVERKGSPTWPFPEYHSSKDTPQIITGDRLDESKSYLQATVDYFDDDPEEPDADMHTDARRGMMLLNQMVGLEPQKGSLDLTNGPVFKSISFLVAGSAGFNASEKQTFLEMTSTRKRLRKSVAALSRIIDRIRLTEEIQSLIGGNGSLPESLKQRLSGL